MSIQLILQTIFRASAGLGDIGELKARHILNIADISDIDIRELKQRP